MALSGPCLSVSVKSKLKAEQEKFGAALGKMVRADPSLHLETDRETGQTILRGMGELHLEVTLDRMRTEFAVEASWASRRSHSRNHHQEITKQYVPRSKPAVRASSPKFGSFSSRSSAAPASSSSTRPVVAPCRRNSCPRGKDYGVQKEDGVLAHFPTVDFRARSSMAVITMSIPTPLTFEIAAKGRFPRGVCAKRRQFCLSR